MFDKQEVFAANETLSLDQIFALTAFLAAFDHKDNSKFYEAHYLLNKDNEQFNQEDEQDKVNHHYTFKDLFKIDDFVDWYLADNQQDNKLLEGLKNNQLSRDLVYDLLEQIEGYADYCHETVDYYDSDEFKSNNL